MKDNIYINYGKNPIKMTNDLMEKAKVSKYLKSDMKVIIKPNLVLPSSTKNGATTHSEIVEGIIKYLQTQNITDISIAEGAWVGEKTTTEAFKVCGYTDLSKRYDINLIDTKKEETIDYEIENIRFRVSKIFQETDYLINVPVLKGHCQTKLTNCLKNLKGCIPDKDKRYYHNIGLHKPIALLNTLLKPDLHIIDSICGDLTFEEGGNPIESNRILLGYDGLLLDSYCSRLIAYNPEEIEYITYSAKYNVGKLFDEHTKIIELNKSNKDNKDFIKSELAKELERYVDENSACSPCYAGLIFALNKAENNPKDSLNNNNEKNNNENEKNNNKIRIGQGFKGQTNDEDLGIGDCCKNFSKYVKGCPPSGLDILNYLNSFEFD
ncbi:MAG: DUF362 domain-containing protein [Methanobrevibacter sp.]|jgi:uncharacterized protein (DUF362 family)|nr:DUF362 domain-containing protein [Candidatus Methanovirga australis]